MSYVLSVIFKLDSTSAFDQCTRFDGICFPVTLKIKILPFIWATQQHSMQCTYLSAVGKAKSRLSISLTDTLKIIIKQQQISSL